MAENGVRAGSLYYAVAFDRTAIKAAKDEATRIGKALSDILEKSVGGFGKKVQDEFKQAGQAAENTAQRTRRATDSATAAAREHVAELRRLTNEQKAGTITNEQYRQKVTELRGEMESATEQTTRGTQAYDLLQNALGRIATAETRDRLNALNNEVFASRNMLENGALSAKDFRSRMDEIVTTARAMQEEMVRTEGATARQSQEYRKLSNAIGGAERGLAALDGHMTKLGMSRQLQIGGLAALRRHFSDLGPAGNAAGLGIAAVVGGLNSLGKPLDLSVAGLHKLAGRLMAVTQALPLLATAAAAGAVVGLMKMADSSAKLANDLDLASRSTGLGVEALQEWRFAAEQSGVSADTFTNLLTSLQRRLGSAANGNKNYAAAFAELGVEIRDTSGNIRNLGDVLNDVATGMSRVENETDRVRLATTIMNRSGAQLTAFFAQGSEAIREMRHEARELGFVISGDAVMSLVEYSNEIQNVRRQFDTTKVEISAAFLPVLRDVLIPVVQDFFVPWMQNAAEQVVEFAESFADVGPAGVNFRAEMLSNMKAVIEFGRVIAVVVQSAITAFNAVASVGGAVGGFIAGIADAEWMEDQRNVLEAQINFLREQLKDTNLAADARSSIVSQLSDATAELELLPQDWWDAGVQGAIEGFEYFGTKAAEGFEGIIDTLNADVEGMLEKWMNHAFQGRDDRRTVRSFGDDLGDDFAGGFLDGATSGLSGTSGKDDPLAAVRLWTRRLAFELEQGLKTPIAVIDILRPRLQDLITERDTLFEAGGFGTEAWDVLEGKIKAIEAAMKSASERLPALISGPKPDEGEGGTWAEHLAEEHAARAARYAEIAERAGIGSVAGVAEANTLALQALETAMREEAAAWAAWQRARQATVAQPDEGASDTAFGRVYEKLKADLREVDLRASLFGETTSTVQARIRLQEQAVLDLAREYGELSPEVEFAKAGLEGLEQQLEDLNSTTEDTANVFGDRLGQAIAGGLGWFANHAQDLGAAGKELESLRTQLANLTGTAETAEDRLRSGLQALIDAGGPAATVAEQLLATFTDWEAAAPDRIVEEYAEAMADAALKAEIFGDAHDLAGTQADLTAKVIERLIPILGVESDTVQQLIEDWKELNEERENTKDKTKDAVPSISTLTEALNTLRTATQGGKVSSDDLSSSLNIVGGALLDLSRETTGTTSEVLHFAGTLTQVAAQAIQGDWVGAIMTAVTQLFDFSNGLKEIEEQVQRTVSGSSRLWKEFVDDIAAANTERVRRSGFLGALGFTKAAIDQESYDAGVALAEGIVTGFESTLTASNFEEAWDQAFTDVIIESAIQVLFELEHVQDAIKQAYELMAAGDEAGAKSIMAGVKEDFREVWEMIQELTKERDAEKLFERIASIGVPALTTVEQAQRDLDQALQDGVITLEQYNEAMDDLADAQERLNAQEHDSWLDRVRDVGVPALTELERAERDLERAFRDGKISAQEYAAGLQEIEMAGDRIAAQDWTTYTASISDSLASSVTSGFQQGFEDYLASGDHDALLDDLEGTVYFTLTKALTESLLTLAMVETGAEKIIKQMGEALAEGDHARASELSRQLANLNADIAGMLTPFLDDWRTYAPASVQRDWADARRPADTTPTPQRGGGIQVAEITGPSRDILVDLLSPLRGLDGLLGVQLRQLEVQEAIHASLAGPGLDPFGHTPIYSGTGSPAPGAAGTTHTHNYYFGPDGTGVGTEFDSPEFRAAIEDVVNEFTQRGMRRRGRGGG